MFFSCYTYTRNFIQPTVPALWAHAFSNESKKPEVIYSECFYDHCARLCANSLHLDLRTDVASLNSRDVYLFLINNN